MDNARHKFHKLALNESFERVARVAKERAEFNRFMALSNGSNPMDNAPMLKPCPFCGEAVQHRFALHVSDGNTDDIIHAAPTDCGLQFFSVGSADHGATVAAAWNTRKHDPSALVAATSSIDFHQRRGMLSDTVDWAVLEYDEFMKDDAYDAQAVLDRIIARLREVNAALAGAGQ